jgi:hypothetical protein
MDSSFALDNISVCEVEFEARHNWDIKIVVDPVVKATTRVEKITPLTMTSIFSRDNMKFNFEFSDSPEYNKMIDELKHLRYFSEPSSDDNTKKIFAVGILNLAEKTLKEFVKGVDYDDFDIGKNRFFKKEYYEKYTFDDDKNVGHDNYMYYYYKKHEVALSSCASLEKGVDYDIYDESKKCYYKKQYIPVVLDKFTHSFVQGVDYDEVETVKVDKYYKKQYLQTDVSLFSLSRKTVNEFSINFQARLDNNGDCSTTLFIQVQPYLGDDYPFVLRKMKSQIALTEEETHPPTTIPKRKYILFVDEFTAKSATREEVQKIFYQSNIIIIFWISFA